MDERKYLTLNGYDTDLSAADPVLIDKDALENVLTLKKYFSDKGVEIGLLLASDMEKCIENRIAERATVQKEITTYIFSKIVKETNFFKSQYMFFFPKL